MLVFDLVPLVELERHNTDNPLMRVVKTCDMTSVAVIGSLPPDGTANNFYGCKSGVTSIREFLEGEIHTRRFAR